MRPQLWAPAAPALLIGLLAAVLAALFTGLPTTLVPAASAADCGGSAVTGTAFRDYNANGTRDALEPGIGGIVVTATGANGSSVTCTTIAGGTYGIDPPGGFPARIEFALPAGGSLGFLSPGPAGLGSRTTVTFVAAPSTGVDVGFVNPAEYCGASTPELISACPAFGEQNDISVGLFWGAAVLYRFPYSAGSTNLGDQGAVAAPAPAILATARQIGTTAGLAWNPRTQTLYAAAFMKRHAGFGPSGPGAIYQWTSAGPSLFYNFGAIAGVDPHPQPSQTCLSPTRNDANTNLNCWLHDTNAFDVVGKVGFGDLQLGPDFATLYAVNLADRTLLAIPLANPAGYTATGIPVPAGCAAADFRPFALGANDGVLYVGAVCTAESTLNRSSLRAYVLAYANGAFRPTPAFDFALTYDRGPATRQWQYWLNRTTFNRTNPLQSAGRWAQPWLTDIAFDHGDMILALRDRTGDQFGIAAGGPDPLDPTNDTAFSQGDLLRACAAAGGGWSLENDGSCGGITTAGIRNGQGPGGGEYYYQDRQAQPVREETSWGSLVQIPGRSEVAATAYGPYEAGNATGDGGVKWYANATGAAVRGYRAFDGTGEPIRFDSANGLSGLVALCPAAPLEIGNRIWRDGNGNGIQDPGEAGIAGVSVALYRSDTLVGTTTTAGDGTYLFNATNVTLNGATGIESGVCNPGGTPVYSVRVPNIAGASVQAPLAGLSLTGALKDVTVGGSLRDSNGQPSALGAGAPAAVAPVACAALSVPGADDHTIDFGFRPPLLTAVPQTLATDEDTPLAITLTGTGLNNLPLTFSVVNGPANGVLTGTPPQVTYTPGSNFNGQDSFTFKASDGQFDSAPAAVTITVRPVNDPPTVPSDDPRGAQVVTTEEDTPVAFVVAASDADGDPLTYTVVDPPAHGTLSGTLPNVVYQPNANFNGSDGFNFAVSDGSAQVSGTVRIEVTPVNDPPVAIGQFVTITITDPITITLSAVDVEGDPLTYRVVSRPQYGTLSVLAPDKVAYTANALFGKDDQFTFRANDGAADSNIAAVNIHVQTAPVGLDVVPEPALLDRRLFLPVVTGDP
jgi:hypothetical protein